MESKVFEYIDITDPIHLATNTERAEEDYILVKAKSCEKVPIKNWDPPAYCYTRRFQNYEKELFNFEVKKDDVWVSSFPKSGTTWCQEMVWLICHGLDFSAAKSEPLSTRFPFLEVSLIHDTKGEINSFERARDMPSPRFIKTHLAVSMLPKQYWDVLPKTVHIHRNVKSVALSYFHHSKRIFYRGTKEEFIRSFMKDLQFYSPIHAHVIGYHSLKNCRNILFLKYEDMKSNLRGCVETVCRFFDRSYSDEELDLLCQHLSFDSMKQNLACNYEDKNNDAWESKSRDERFIRRGEIDSWKDELSLEIVEELNQWTNDTVKNLDQMHLFL
ncbi:luciferin sulfotransferase-like [Topomyia yanbarensis]|uniref:luciferin sulfotransferase-like n=1 Tax=Topomyia yanbarensis TaxID=2498891 RepID=UPI00273A7A01|nr:luciferin sulfotransferase-like [Topomyia yanbarensis]